MLEGLLITLFITGIFAGLVLGDLRERRRSLAVVTKTKAEMQDAAAKIIETHNNLVTQLKHLSDKVNTHEFVIKSRGDGEPPGGKRF